MKKWCAIFFALFIGISHIIFLCLYLLPPNPLTNLYRVTVNWYVEPIFTQNWKLFAPDPVPYSLKVFYKCAHDGKWHDPIQSVLQQHQKNRISYRGKLLYVYNNLIVSLINTKDDACKNDPATKECINPISNPKVLGDNNYKKMAAFISKYCDSNKFAFRVAKVYTLKFSERNNPEAKREIMYDEYQVN